MAYRDRKPSAEKLLLDIVEWSERLAGHVQAQSSRASCATRASETPPAGAWRSSAKRRVA